jgi:hypothetical protein
MDPTLLATSSVPAGFAGSIVGIVSVLLTAIWLALFWR